MIHTNPKTVARTSPAIYLMALLQTHPKLPHAKLINSGGFAHSPFIVFWAVLLSHTDKSIICSMGFAACELSSTSGEVWFLVRFAVRVTAAGMETFRLRADYSVWVSQRISATRSSDKRSFQYQELVLFLHCMSCHLHVLARKRTDACIPHSNQDAGTEQRAQRSNSEIMRPGSTSSSLGIQQHQQTAILCTYTAV